MVKCSSLLKIDCGQCLFTCNKISFIHCLSTQLLTFSNTGQQRVLRQDVPIISLLFDWPPASQLNCNGAADATTAGDILNRVHGCPLSQFAANVNLPRARVCLGALIRACGHVIVRAACVSACVRRL